MSDFIDDGFMKDFFEEAFSQIEIIEENLLILEKDPSDKEAIDCVFRAAHTLKGGSATVQMDEITSFTHVVEDVMDEVRSGNLKINSNMADLLLSALDILKNMVQCRADGTAYTEDVSSTKNGLADLLKKKENSKKTPAKKSTKKEKKGGIDTSRFAIAEYDLLELNESNPDSLPMYKVIVSFDENNPMRTVGGIQVFTSLRDISMVLKTYPDFDEIYSEEFHKEIMYIVASDAEPEKIKEYTVIPDATVEIVIEPLELDNGSVQPEQGKPENQEVDLDAMAQAITKEAIQDVSGDTPVVDAVDNGVMDEIRKEQTKKSPETKKKQGSKFSSSSVLRVEASRIDDLLNLVSEIVINKASFNQISGQFVDNLESLYFTMSEHKDRIKQFTESIPSLVKMIEDGKSFNSIKKEVNSHMATLNSQFDPFASTYKSIIDRFRSTSQNLDRISGLLQEGVMRVRMVQIKQIFNRFPRLVRDLSRDLEKDIELVIEGEETEVDKAMIDDLIDPLIHIVRNAIDHGIESPEERSKAGKSSPARLKLSAFNEGNMITIYISDDGKGIDVEKIKSIAIEKGLIQRDTIIRDKDAYNLIFDPGFSTAEKVTSISGRGVGLDVVKRNIEKLSGSIRVNSSYGDGTTFIIKLPLTLAIIQGLLVTIHDEIYAIPISSVMESLRIRKHEIKMLDNYEVINVREDVLSLLRLSRLFESGEDTDAEYYFVVIVGTGEKKIGLLVDSLIGEEDIVIKPLKDKYSNTPGIAGATILGDGTVSLILDVSQIIELGLTREIGLKKSIQ
jgi:two-component system chemotaxis sensor kinase CheA